MHSLRKGISAIRPTTCRPRKRLQASVSSYAAASLEKKQQRPPRPMFQVPDLVVDLDAEDNEHVRLYDDEMEAAEARKWRLAHASIDALQERLAAFSDEVDGSLERRDKVATTSSPWRVLDRDIWSAALGQLRLEEAAGDGGEMGEMGEQVEGSSERLSESSVMARLAYENGISPRMAQDPSQAIQSLLRRQQIAIPSRRSQPGEEGAVEKGPGERIRARQPDKAGKKAVQALAGGWQKRGRKPVFADIDDCVAALSQCQDLVELRRLLVVGTQTVQDSRTVAAAGAAVASQLSRHLPVRLSSAGSPFVEPAAAAISTAMLNLSYNLGAKNVALGRDLCGVGVQAAAATMEPAAIQRFLAIGQDYHYWTDYWADGAGSAETTLTTALNSLCTALGRVRRQRLWPVPRAELLAVVAGWPADGSRSSAGEKSQTVSFRTACAGLEGGCSREAYLAVLAELGAVRTLWEALKQRPSEKMDRSAVLVTAVLRYAYYIGTSWEERSSSSTKSAKTDKTARGGGRGQDNWILDMQVLLAFDEAAMESAVRQAGRPADGTAVDMAAGTEQAIPVLHTLRMPRQQAVETEESEAEELRHDEDFVVSACEAFTETSVDKAMHRIHALLVRHEVVSRKDVRRWGGEGKDGNGVKT